MKTYLQDGILYASRTIEVPKMEPKKAASTRTNKKFQEYIAMREQTHYTFECYHCGADVTGKDKCPRCGAYEAKRKEEKRAPSTPTPQPAAQEWNLCEHFAPHNPGFYEVRLPPSISSDGIAYYFGNKLWSGWASKRHWKGHQPIKPEHGFSVLSGAWKWREIPKSPTTAG